MLRVGRAFARAPPGLTAALRRAAHTQRHANLRAVTAADVEHFSRILPHPSGVLSTLAGAGADDLVAFNNDWMGKFRGHATTVLRPRSTSEVAAIVKYCNEQRIGVVPQGGNTGLVGGSVPIGDEGQEVVLSLSAMRDVRSFDANNGILVADAGCVLESLSTYLEPHGYIMPLDLGAKGSCQIGGNVSTNAGGLRLLRYGSLHGSVLGLEVVLPDGTILDGLSALRKDNTGYDLKQLFIGAEGTLGVVTAVSILTAPAPANSNVVLLALPHFQNVIPVYKRVRAALGEILSAFEYFDRSCYDLVLRHGQPAPFSGDDIPDTRAFVLIETSGASPEHDEERLTTFIEDILSSSDLLVQNGVMSTSKEQFSAIWRLREGITECLGREGKAYKYDISIPVPKFAEAVDTVRDRVQSLGLLGRPQGGVKLVVGYGHVGDGNLHLNVLADEYSDEINAALEPFIFEMVAGYRGSVSAEHGIGSSKVDALKYSKSDASRTLMKKIKDLFDPNGIMNPGKVLPS